MTPRIIISIVLSIHGLIHVLGFLKEWKIPVEKDAGMTALTSLSTGESKTIGLLWLLGGIGVIASGLFFLLGKNGWWIVGAISFLLSQLLIILNWYDAKYGTLLNILLILVVIISYHHQRFTALIKKETTTLLDLQINTPAETVTAESIKRLPAPVRQWLTKSGVAGREKVKTVHLKQRGTMRSKPDGKWMAMEAEQYITANSPGFIWTGTMGKTFSVVGRDKYIDRKGSMLIKFMSTIPIGNSSGEEIDQGAMMRYLAEITWVPSAALSEYIHWGSINDTTARATFTNGNRTVSGLFYFNHEGDVIGFEGKRYGNFDGHFSLETWSIRILEHKVFNGIRIGNKCEVTWKLKQGDFTWLKLEVMEISYNDIEPDK